MARIDAEGLGERTGKQRSVGRREAVIAVVVGVKSFVEPDRLTVGSPITTERPTWQWLTGVPLALAEMQKGTRSESISEPLQQCDPLASLLWPQGGPIPLRGVPIIHADESRLSAHRQPHVPFAQIEVDLPAECVDGVPLLFGVRLGHPRCFVDPGDGHPDFESLFDFVVVVPFRPRIRPAHRRGRLRVGGAGQGDMPLGRHQPGCRVEAHPAGAGHVDFRPGVQVGEVRRWPFRAFQGLFVGDQLDQVARGESGRQAEMASQLHQQPSRIPARSATEVERFLRLLHTRIEANGVRHRLLNSAVQPDEVVVEFHTGLAFGGDQFQQFWPRCERFEVRCQFAFECCVVPKWVLFRILFDEEVERVDRRQVGNQIDGDDEFTRRFREDQPREVIAIGVLLPVQKVRTRFDRQRVTRHRRPRVRGRSQTHHVRLQRDRPAVRVPGDVVQSDADGHAGKVLVRIKLGSGSCRWHRWKTFGFGTV